MKKVLKWGSVIFVSLIIGYFIRASSTQDLTQRRKLIHNTSTSETSVATPEEVKPTKEIIEGTYGYTSYLEEMQSILATFSKASLELGELMQKVADGSITELEASKILTNTAILVKSYGKASLLKPPAKFKKMHQKYLSGFRDAKDGALAFETGVREFDFSYFEIATDYFLDSTKAIEEANEMMDKFNEEYL